jgi:hypothetical protein
LQEIDREGADGLEFSVYLRTRHSDQDTPYGVWNGKFSSDNLRFDGRWTNGPLGSSVPLAFRAIAVDRVVVRTSGLNVAGHGRTASFDGTYPRFLDPTLLDRSVENALQAVVAQSAKCFARFRLWSDWEDLWWALRYETGTNSWEYHDEWDLTFQSDVLVSIVCHRWSYTGGVHESSDILARVYWWNGHDAVPVQLADFFAPNTGWQSKLAMLCNRDLGVQRSLQWYDEEATPEDLQPGVEVEDLETFTVHQDGFRFHFPTYSIGSYAEGAYVAFVPFHKIEHLLGKTGPAAALRNLRNEAQ